MLPVILFLICIIASSVGAIVGAGGGVIIKPVMDMLGLLPVSTVSFCSGCTVLAMSVSSLIRNRNDGIRLQLKTGTALALGAVFGGLSGQWLFDVVRTSFGNERMLGAIQSACLVVVTIVVLIYVKNKHKLTSKHVENFAASVLIGVTLGMISAFIGIGGGPVNVAVLFFFFSMDAKEAAKNSIYIIIFSQTSSILTAFASGTVPDFSWVNLIAMMAGGVGGALVGSAISKRMNNQGVEKLFQVLLYVITAIGCYNILKYTVL